MIETLFTDDGLDRWVILIVWIHDNWYNRDHWTMMATFSPHIPVSIVCCHLNHFTAFNPRNIIQVCDIYSDFPIQASTDTDYDYQWWWIFGWFGVLYVSETGWPSLSVTNLWMYWLETITELSPHAQCYLMDILTV